MVNIIVVNQHVHGDGESIQKNNVNKQESEYVACEHAVHGHHHFAYELEWNDDVEKIAEEYYKCQGHKRPFLW